MNIKYLKILKVIFLILISCSQLLLSKNEYEVKKIDNPSPGYLMMDGVSTLIDNYGNHVLEENINFGTSSFKLLKNGLFAQGVVNDYYLYDKDMKIVDTIFNNTKYVRDPHDLISLANGHYLMLCTESFVMDLSKVVEGGNPKANIISNVLVETDTKGNIYWQWRAIDHTNIKDVANDIELTQFTIDFTHINSLDEDINGNILISIRHFDEIALINKTTGDFIWRMGGFYCKNNQFTFINDNENGFSGFSHQHCASILPNGNILLYDNGNLKPNLYSRAVEYSVDVSLKTATKVWEYRNSPDIYNSTFGTVYRLENGNSLINFSNGKIVEVKPDNSIAFEINSTLNDIYYRVQKSTLNAIYSKRNISNTGNFEFINTPNNTGVRLELSAVTGNSPVYIQKHNYAPNGEYADTIPPEILPYRWVITHDENLDISGTFNLNASTIQKLPNPEKMIIFQRTKETSGVFQELSTTYNSVTGEFSAPFSGFGEFIIGKKNVSSVIESQNDNILKIYSNSNSDILQIYLKENNYPANLKIYDLRGNLVLFLQLNSFNSNIDVSKLFSGVYIVLINNQKGIWIKD
jgi:hypothetical protein